MRIVTFGYQTWGHRTLSAVLGSEHEVVLAVTHPASDHPYERMWSDSVEDLAREHEVPVHVAKRPDAALHRAVADAGADLAVANNWRTWLPASLHDAPRLGTLNVHDSLLPRYAGFSPIVWALINGEPHVGVTAHMMDEGLDTGPIVAQQSVAVGPQDTAADLVRATVDLVEPLVLRSLDLVEAGVAPAPQDPTRASYFAKRSVADSHVDWTWPADAICRLVRAQSEPYPNAFCWFGEERLEILSATVSAGRFGGPAGRTLVRVEGGAAVVAGPDAWRGGNHAVVVHRVRRADGAVCDAAGLLANSGVVLR